MPMWLDDCVLPISRSNTFLMCRSAVCYVPPGGIEWSMVNDALNGLGKEVSSLVWRLAVGEALLGGKPRSRENWEDRRPAVERHRQAA
ncbi:hypothetical protein DEO72_LG10g949 [Vigna unguiculata]|uniref:Uncharacterized protein n=1 Tax=Vigna unguiculata TaxID=3917 RepID=A0A4D6N7J9_VIGUN|nr:hypothetical protein DEO72_LG10g949 [Vigna unguiculata]